MHYFGGGVEFTQGKVIMVPDVLRKASSTCRDVQLRLKPLPLERPKAALAFDDFEAR